MPTSINVKGYDKPFTFPDGMSQEDIQAALETIPPAPPGLASEVPKVLDTGIRGAITGLPGLIADTVTGQTPGKRQFMANLLEALPGPGGMLAAKDFRTRQTPLTQMAPSAALDYGMQAPETQGGKFAGTVLGGVTGAFLPGGNMSNIQRLITGLSSGGGAYVGGEALGGGALGAALGGIAGGFAPGVVNRFIPNEAGLAKETFADVTDADFSTIVKNMKQAEGQGFSINASQANPQQSNLDAIVDYLNSHRQGLPIKQQLREQPGTIKRAAELELSGLPGFVLEKDPMNAAVQAAATGRIDQLRKLASGAWERYARPVTKAGGKEFAPEDVAQLEQKLLAFRNAPQHENTPYAAMADEVLTRIRKAKQGEGLPGMEAQPAQPAVRDPYTGAVKVPARPAQPAQSGIPASPEYVTNPIALRDAIEGAIGGYQARTLSTKGPDAKMLKKTEDLRGMFKELVDARMPELSQANNAYSSMIRSVVNPAKEGVFGRLAGTRGFADGTLPSDKIFKVFDEGVTKGATTSTILTAERGMRKVDPDAFPNAVKSYFNSKFQKAFEKTGTNEFPTDIASQLKVVLGDPIADSQRWHTTRDMLAGVARSKGVPDNEVVDGLKVFMTSIVNQTKRPAGTPKFDPMTVSEATGSKSLRNAGLINPFTPFKAPMYWSADKTDSKVLSTVAESLTSSEGLLKLRQLARTAPDSPMREALLKSIVAGGGATGSWETTKAMGQK